ncbi:MAG: tetratricopeptide repeat protein [Proteobacteria bacterium]|nr:tetratricopeptide repeat protein [Pseudomonadota bacterium]
MDAAPTTEARALLLTDLVGSTRLAERLGDAAMAELNAAHDRAARDLLRAWGGREIDKTDGWLLLFDSVAAAVGCALAYHRAIAALPTPLAARAGVHWGAVTLRANLPPDVAQGAKPLEVEGLAKPVAARVMSLAGAGQTLLTREAREQLPAAAWRVQAHGHWRIKGVAEPIELFEAGDEGAPFVPPPDSGKVYRVVRRGELWLPMREVRHSLPAERDAFVGRGDALADLAGRFGAGARLVSVLGIGGSGKTRLAVRYGWVWLGDFPGGVWFCDLAQARSTDGLLHAVAQGLDVPLGAGDAVAQLGHAIAGRGACLVVLDNFEQVARHAADTLGRWLDRAARARFLVTTREVLGLPGEEALALPPLRAPEAEALFLRRAAAAWRGFEPSAADRQAVTELVALLDGLPLAIELAAARVRVMPPAVLRDRMDQRFRVLVAGGGRRDRQATLRAAFDWSWELLDAAERTALAQLSVFAGGFTLEAAEAVLDLAACGATPWAVDVLQSLVDKSLVQRVGDNRFELLQSVQDYAAEHLASPGRLAGSGPQAARAAQLHHARWFAARGTAAWALDGEADLDNLVVACRRSVLHGDAPAAVGTLEAAWEVLSRRGPFGVGAELARAVAALPGHSAAGRARIGLVAGSALDAIGRSDEAGQSLGAALDDARGAGDRRLEAQILLQLGHWHGNESRPEAAEDHYAQAQQAAAAAGARELACAAANGLGTVAIDRGDAAAAQQHYQAALRLAGEIGDRRSQCRVLGNLGGLELNQGRLGEAEGLLQEQLRLARALRNRMWEGNALCNLGALQQMQSRCAEAQALALAALELARTIGHRRLECVVHCNLGLNAFAQADRQAAEAHYGDALALARELHDRRSQGLFLGYLAQVQAAARRIDAARASLAAGEALLAAVADRFSLGLLACHRAEVELAAGDFAAAHSARADARRTADELGAGDASELGLALARAEAMLADRTAPAG